MGVDSKLFVVCKQEEKMIVVKKVLETLNALSFERLQDKEKESRYSRLQIINNPLTFGRYSVGARVSSRDFELFTIDFGVGDGIERIAWVHTTGDCDVASYLQEGMGAVIISVGCWGSNVMIMHTIADALKPFGNVYIDYNDCDDVDYVKVN